MRNVIARFFPNHPGIPLDVPITEFEGLYVCKGYGAMRLVAETRGPNQGSLVTERPEMTWHYSLRLRHVSERFWIACESRMDDMDNPFAFHPVEFLEPEADRPLRLRITWVESLYRVDANATFRKVN